MNDHRIELAAEWFAKAGKDEYMASRNLKDRKVSELVCFHAQQAVEKYLKGLLVLHGATIDTHFKTHDLSELYKMVHAVLPGLNGRVLAACRFLNRFYIQTRYPGDESEAATFVDATSAVRFAAIVRSTVHKLG